MTNKKKLGIYVNQPGPFLTGLYFGLGFWLAFILLLIPASCMAAIIISIINA